MRIAIFVSAASAALMAGPVGAKEPTSVDFTGKGAPELSGCLALKVADYRLYRVVRTGDDQHVTLKIKFDVAGIPATAATFIVDDLGDRRRLTIFATGKANGLPKKVAVAARSCV